MNARMMFVEEIILLEIGDKEFTRDNVSVTYAFGLRNEKDDLVHDPVDWRKVNEAILERWSPYALSYIKGRAWKILLGEVDLCKHLPASEDEAKK